MTALPPFGKLTIVRAVPRCLTCNRFVTPAKCNHYVEFGEYGVVHSTEYECERCAAARPHDRPPTPREADR